MENDASLIGGASMQIMLHKSQKFFQKPHNLLNNLMKKLTKIAVFHGICIWRGFADRLSLRLPNGRLMKFGSG